jgi:tripartite-type tricarboxylate transporter receptor subunit TctC
MRKLVLAVLLLCGAAGVTIAAEPYPNRPVRIVVPFVPGGSMDLIGRVLGRQLSERFGQQFVVENKAGAGGNVGAEYVAKAKPDGYTLLVWGDGLLINTSLYTNPPFDPLKDFAPISQAVLVPNVLIAQPRLSAQTLPDLLALARATPGKFSYGSPGSGTPGHLSGEALNLLTGAGLVHVPYRGAGPAITDVVAAQIDLAFVAVPGAIGQIRAGAVRALAVSSAERLPALPDVPSIAEAGVGNYYINAWHGVLAPTGTPLDIINQLSTAVRDIVALPQVRDQLIEQGFKPTGTTPAQLARTLRDDLPRWRELVAKSGAKAD